ncbi:extensin-like domain-containing protein [Pseudocitrobacter cyperus]|uniref:Extensin family protein n=1 Tax=Pseudocitrobacter cyperus TaxID=3112843 RepID=A0ABV0HJF7_9ENTR
MKITRWLVLAGVIAAGYGGYRMLPAWYNPFTPLMLNDPPGLITRWKLKAITDEQCQALLAEANQQKLISTRSVAPGGGACPLTDVVQVSDFGAVKLSNRFLASCRLALGSALFVEQQVKPLSRQMWHSEVTRIDHLGSFACRNIYHRADGPLSEHATASALDISGFRLANGQHISVLKGWQQPQTQPFLKALLEKSCQYYGNGLGPDYNAAHANHFHLGMRGYGLCR